MYEQISRNKWKSAALVVFFMAFIFLLTWFFEYLTGWGKGGLVLAVAVAMGMAAVGYYASDKIVLTISRARPVTKDEFPYLYNVVEGLAIAAGVPAPQVLRHRGHGPQRLRRRPQARDRLDLRHDRHPREAQPGRARGRHRPRDVPHQELRRPAPDRGRGHGRRRRPAQRLDDEELHVGRRGPAARPRAGAARAGPRASSSSSAWPWPSSRRSSPRSSSWPSRASASSWPTRARPC